MRAAMLMIPRTCYTHPLAGELPANWIV